MLTYHHHKSSRNSEGSSNTAKIHELHELLKVESLSHQQTGESYQALQNEYDALLKKYAQAENTIDELRLGAKVRLMYDHPKIPNNHCAVEPARSISVHHISAPQKQKAYISRAISVPKDIGASSFKVGCTYLGDTSSLASRNAPLIDAVHALKCDVDAMQSLCGDLNLSVTEQDAAYNVLKENFLQLQERVKSFRCRDQGSKSEAAHFEWLESEMNRLSLRIDELADQLQVVRRPSIASSCESQDHISVSGRRGEYVRGHWMAGEEDVTKIGNKSIVHTPTSDGDLVDNKYLQISGHGLTIVNHGSPMSRSADSGSSRPSSRNILTQRSSSDAKFSSGRRSFASNCAEFRNAVEEAAPCSRPVVSTSSTVKQTFISRIPVRRPDTADTNLDSGFLGSDGKFQEPKFEGCQECESSEEPTYQRTTDNLIRIKGQHSRSFVETDAVARHLEPAAVVSLGYQPPRRFEQTSREKFKDFFCATKDYLAHKKVRADVSIPARSVSPSTTDAQSERSKADSIDEKFARSVSFTSSTSSASKSVVSSANSSVDKGSGLLKQNSRLYHSEAIRKLHEGLRDLRSAALATEDSLNRKFFSQTPPSAAPSVMDELENIHQRIGVISQHMGIKSDGEQAKYTMEHLDLSKLNKKLDDLAKVLEMKSEKVEVRDAALKSCCTCTSVRSQCRTISCLGSHPCLLLPPGIHGAIPPVIAATCLHCYDASNRSSLAMSQKQSTSFALPRQAEISHESFAFDKTQAGVKLNGRFSHIDSNEAVKCKLWEVLCGANEAALLMEKMSKRMVHSMSSELMQSGCSQY